MADQPSRGRRLENPPWIQALFGDTRFAWIWLTVRIYVGWIWLHAGWEKVTSDGWMSGGAALQGFWERVVLIPEGGRPAISYDWYRAFLEFLLESETYTWFAKMIAVGEVMVGLGLIFGALTGIAALFGMFMNFNFMLAGISSTNPILALLAALLVVAWKTAGWWGIDRVLLPAVGAPWQRGRLFGGEADVGGGTPSSRPALIEQWLRVLISVVVALTALIQLSGAAQVITLLGAGVLLAVTGLGWLQVLGRQRR